MHGQNHIKFVNHCYNVSSDESCLISRTAVPKIFQFAEFQDVVLFAEKLQELIRYAVLRRRNNITSETYVMLFNGLSRTGCLCVSFLFFICFLFILCTRICVERAVSTVA